MTVYIVQGSTGEYEDYTKWIAKAFLSKDKAENFMSKCVEYAKYMIEEDRHPEDGMIYPRWMFEKYCSPDSNFTIDYTGTFYCIYAVEVEE